MHWTAYYNSFKFLFVCIMLFNKTIWQALKDAYEAKKIELKVKKITLQLLEQFKSLDGLKEWFRYKLAQVRPNGLYEMVEVSKVHIIVSKDDVIVQGELANGTYINELVKFKEEDVKRLAMRMAVDNLEHLKENKKYCETELERINGYLADVEARITSGELKLPEEKKEKEVAVVKAKPEKKLKKPTDVISEKKRGRPKKNS